MGENLVWVKLYSLAAILFTLFCGYLLGSLRRDTQVWRLVNDLKAQISNKETAQQKLLEAELRLVRQNACLAKLDMLSISANLNPSDFFKQLVLEATLAAQVSRASVWLYSRENNLLSCEIQYDFRTLSYSQPPPLQTQHLPHYFEAIQQYRVLAVNDAYAHPATVEFTVDYLPKTQVSALLDATIWLADSHGQGDVFAGVVCLEHIGGSRDWTLDEQSFAGSLADLTSLMLEGSKRQQAEGDLRYQQVNLDTIVKTMTASIESNAKLFRFLVERAPVTILYMNAANEIIEMNPEAERISGYTREYAIGRTYQELFETEDNKQQLQMISREVAYGKKLQAREVTIRRADGSTVDLSVSRSMELDDEGNPVIISIGQDMSKQKAAELALRRSEERFRHVVDSAPAAILYMDNSTKVIEINPEVEIVSGYKRDEIIGKTFYELFSDKAIRAQHLKIFKKILAGEKLQGLELQMRRADGSTGEYSISASLDQDNDGNTMIIAIAQDMSIQKALEASLITAREAAESADRIKSMFVASMSHELRTPLNSIIGFIGVVLQGMSGELNPQQKGQLSRAYHSSKHLLSLISDVIDISKIEAGYLQVYTEHFELKPLLDEVQQAVHHIIEEKHLALNIVCEEGVVLESDRKRLYQVLLNVVGNGLKYTEKGDVNVTTQVEHGQLVIHIQDTGIGIDEAGLAKLFKPFERVESRLKIKTLGTGLGLYLTHSILTKLLGGNITVQSKPEIGSTFIITLPITAPEQHLALSSIL